MTTFCGLFLVWYWYHWFLLLGGMKMSGSAGLFKKTNFFLPRQEPKGGRSGRWETQKNNTATLTISLTFLGRVFHLDLPTIVMPWKGAMKKKHFAMLETVFKFHEEVVDQIILKVQTCSHVRLRSVLYPLIYQLQLCQIMMISGTGTWISFKFAIAGALLVVSTCNRYQMIICQMD